MAQKCRELLERTLPGYSAKTPGIEGLRQKAVAGTLSAEEYVYYGLLAERFEGLSVATQIFAKAQTLHNAYAPALYHYGRVLLEQKKAEGIDFINQAMDNDWDIEKKAG